MAGKLLFYIAAQNSTTVHMLVLTVQVVNEHRPDREDQEERRNRTLVPILVLVAQAIEKRSSWCSVVARENGLFPFGAKAGAVLSFQRAKSVSATPPRPSVPPMTTTASATTTEHRHAWWKMSPRSSLFSSPWIMVLASTYSLGSSSTQWLQRLHK